MWAAAPVMAAAVALAVFAPPKPGDVADTRMLDARWSRPWRRRRCSWSRCRQRCGGHLAPCRRHSSRSLPSADRRGGVAADVRSPRRTAYAIGLVLSALVSFWTARRALRTRHDAADRPIVAFAGLIAALLAIALQSSRRRSLIYGRWQPLDAGARPFGPFVNRNHFATWVVMACPLAAVSLAAMPGPRSSVPGVAAKGRGARVGRHQRAWVGLAGIVMGLALLVSTSRSGPHRADVGGLAARRRVAGPRAPHASAGRHHSHGHRRDCGYCRRIRQSGAACLPSRGNGRGRRRRAAAHLAGNARVTRDFLAPGPGSAATRPPCSCISHDSRPSSTRRTISISTCSLRAAFCWPAGPMAAVAFIAASRVRLADDRSPTRWLRIGAAPRSLRWRFRASGKPGYASRPTVVLFAIAAAVAVHRSKADSEIRCSIQP